MLGLVAVLVWLAVFALPDGRLHVTFLDVGQGDAVLIETPSGRQVVIDGGPSATSMAAYLGQRMPFWDRTVDLVVLTDLQDKDAAGLVPVVERYRVGHLWLPAGEGRTPACDKLWTTAGEREISMQTPAAGTSVDMGDGVVLTTLPLGREGVIALRVDYGATCVLLAGSARLEDELVLLGRGERVRCDVLQVGKNGSDSATGTRFLQAVRPALAVISVAGGNGTSKPDQAVLARLVESGATLARIDELGSVELVSDGEGYVARVGR
jgi:competence protein ComEC